MIGLVLVLGAVSLAYCSVGDRSKDFKLCTNRCYRVTCNGTEDTKLPLSLQLTGWTCLQDCQYNCMHEVTAQDVKSKRPVRQFFGKVLQGCIIVIIIRHPFHSGPL